MAWREVRKQNKLLFRFDPERDLIEVRIRGQLQIVCLHDFRPRHHAANQAEAVNFSYIDGIDVPERAC